MITEPSQMDEIFTARECADILKLNVKTVYGLLSEKHEPGKIFARRVGRKWRIRQQEIMRFLNQEPVEVSRSRE